jgi:hypothetical protein
METSRESFHDETGRSGYNIETQFNSPKDMIFKNKLANDA